MLITAVPAGHHFEGRVAYAAVVLLAELPVGLNPGGVDLLNPEAEGSSLGSLHCSESLHGALRMSMHMEGVGGFMLSALKTASAIYGHPRIVQHITCQPSIDSTGTGQC